MANSAPIKQQLLPVMTERKGRLGHPNLPIPSPCQHVIRDCEEEEKNARGHKAKRDNHPHAHQAMSPWNACARVRRHATHVIACTTLGDSPTITDTVR